MKEIETAGDMHRLIKGQRVLVIGMGKSGVSTAGFLSRAGAAEVLASDHKQELEPQLDSLRSLKGVYVRVGVQTPELVEGVSLVVKSPGVPPGLPPLQRARELGVPVITEV